MTDPKDLLHIAEIYQGKALTLAGCPEGDEALMHAKRYRLCAEEIERLRTKLGPLAEDRICLNCGASEPCHLNTAETSGDPNWPGSPCTFDPTPQELWDDNQRLRALCPTP